MQTEEVVAMKNLRAPAPHTHASYALMVVMLSTVSACVAIQCMLHCVDDEQRKVMSFQFEIVALAESSFAALNPCLLNFF